MSTTGPTAATTDPPSRGHRLEPRRRRGAGDVTAGGRRRVAWRIGGGSYQSAGDPRLHFGLGDADRVESIEIRWPSGRVDRLGPLPADAGYSSAREPPGPSLSRASRPAARRPRRLPGRRCSRLASASPTGRTRPKPPGIPGPTGVWPRSRSSPDCLTKRKALQRTSCIGAFDTLEPMCNDTSKDR